MKIVGVIASLLLGFYSIGQKSYYFSDPLPIDGTKMATVDSKWLGIYKSNADARSYEFTEEGIYVTSTSISSISRDAIRESSQYDVRNNMIYGVIKDDSIPCVLRDDRYYFGIQNTDVLIGAGSANVLVKIDANTYMINFEENNVYTPEIISFEKGNLILKDFDYEMETKLFDPIASKEVIPGKDFDIVILSPTAPEFEALLLQPIFTEPDQYKKARK